MPRILYLCRNQLSWQINIPNMLLYVHSILFYAYTKNGDNIEHFEIIKRYSTFKYESTHCLTFYVCQYILYRTT